MRTGADLKGMSRRSKVGTSGTPRTSSAASVAGGPAAWAVFLLAAAATLGGVSPFGVVQPFDLPMGLAAVAAVVATFAGTLRAGRRASGSAWRATAACAAVLAVTAVASTRALDRWAALLGAPGSGLGAAQIAVLLGIVLGAAWMGPGLRRVVEAGAPWLLAAQVVAAAAQLVSGAAGQGTLSNATYLSMVLVACIPPTVARAVDGGRVGRDAASVGRIALSLAAVVVLGFAGARTGTALAAAGLAWMLGPALAGGPGGRSGARGWRGDRVALLAALAGVVGAGIAIASRLTSGASDPLGLGTRPEMWRGAARIIARSPLAGVGPDGYRNALAAVVEPAMILREGAAGTGFALLPADPHNVVLAAAVSLGALGLVALGWLGLEAVRAWIAEGRSAGRMSWPAVSTVLFAAAALLAPATLQNLPLAAVIAGASLPLAASADAGADWRARVQLWVGTAVAVVAVLAAALVADCAGTRFAVGGLSRTDMASALRAQRVAGAWGVDPFLHFGAAVRFRALAAGGEMTALAPAVDAAGRAVRLAPADPFYRTEYAAILAESGKPSAALEEYEIALESFPHSPDAGLGAASALLALDRPAEARTRVERVLEVAPGQARAHEVAAAVYTALGEPERAAAEAAEATRLRGE